MSLELMYITNSPEVARIAEKNGVARIWVDLETLGKEERQKNRDTVKSRHTVQDVRRVSEVLTVSECLVRINPWNDASLNEIEQVIAAGADRIMLPMWRSVAEVDAFLSAVNQRVSTTLLLETAEAADCLEEVLLHPLLEEIHIGLNDLHLSYGRTFMFELLADGTVERLCNRMRQAGIPYGFGGIARIGEGTLPAERIVMEHHRLGSTRVILSRSFCNTEQISDLAQIEELFFENLHRLRIYEDSLLLCTAEDYAENTRAVARCVAEIVEGIRGRSIS